MKVNQILSLAIVISLLSFMAPGKKKITIWMAGDSTMSVKEKRVYPEHGWGMPFAGFFDSSVVVKNLAKNGRSTRTFIAERLWDSIANNARQGDYVFIQFGHNDESKEKTERYTSPGDYRANLLRFINDTRRQDAIPVLLTPVSRRKFKDTVQIQTHEVYSNIVRELAATEKVAFIDLDARSIELYQRLGKEPSRLLFLQLKPGEHPNYPDGKEDNTHFNELGSRLIAQIVLAGVRDLRLELAERIIVPKAK